MVNRRFTTTAIALSLDDASAALPTEFRLFVNGWNKTENGDFLFDADAAREVMAAYQSWGVDLAIDLEHQMLDGVPSADPTARDARGWCKLQLRPDGSLWAVDVKWTPDGATRLEQKRQRYVSPAFEIDPKTKRVTKIINVAITAIPATHDTPALVAAASRGDGMAMDPKLVQQALDALVKGDSKAALDILEQMLVAAAGGDPDASTEDAPPPVGDGGADEMTESAVPPPPAPPADGAPAQDPTKKKQPPDQYAARVMKLAGRATFDEAFAEIEVWRKSHLEMESERQRIAAENAVRESAERRRLCVELVQLGAEFPATVWADPTAKAPSKLKPRWESMPIEALREHVVEQRTARGKRPTATRIAPAAAPTEGGDKEFETPDGPVTLSARELRFCKEAGADPATYAANKARMGRR